MVKEESTRSFKIKKNILFSLFFKGISVLSSLVIVPMTLHYLTPIEYGVWLTLSSIMTWITLFDIGLGNGLRNKLAESLAFKDIETGKVLVSTTFALLFVLIGIFLILFLFINPFLDWSAILNTSVESSATLNKIVLIVFIFFSFQFIFKIVGTVFIADQKPAANDFLGAISSLLSLGLIYLLSLFTTGSLLYVSIVFSAVPSIVFIVTFFIAFKYQYKSLRPSFYSIDWSYGKSLISLGIQFFILQIGGIILYFSSNLIVAQLYSPYEVTVYNIAYKYANIISMICIIIITPLWSSSTDAYHLKDWKWFRQTERKMLVVFFFVVIFATLLLLASSWLYKIWIGNNINISLNLTLVMIVYNLCFVFSSIYIYMLNGIGKIRLQLWSSLFEAMFTIPLSVFLGKNIGVEGVMLGMLLVILFRCIWAPIQFRKIIAEKANGIWNK
ncbi:MAG: oligosaccharide flippase family protein [Paludibacter sp.]|nr:oligosaccharide flippase family protein [Paludibacter sp.]